MKTTSKPTPKLPSIVRRESYGSVTVYWLDREAAKQQAKRAAEKLAQARPEVIAVYLFGSLAKNKAGPRSDVDILVVLRETDIPVWFKRQSVYCEYFDEEIELPTELFCFTLEELPRKAVARHALQYAELLAGTDIRNEVKTL
ncbi:MAG: nucleotidyltransferase domain-containing protein [Fimbriimonadales bacterium]|nr:nucleotidyltransferase domain-containing protein [Fimbriimonadales bacterium]